MPHHTLRAQHHSLLQTSRQNISQWSTGVIDGLMNWYCCQNSRYRTSNLISTSILPGPKEQTADEIQRFLRPIISDLLRLYTEGILVYSPSHPNGRFCLAHLHVYFDWEWIFVGRRVRVVLLALVCDKPAAHKIAGFGSHSHTCFCTVCWIKIKDKKTAQSFKPGGKLRNHSAQDCSHPSWICSVYASN